MPFLVEQSIELVWSSKTSWNIDFSLQAMSHRVTPDEIGQTLQLEQVQAFQRILEDKRPQSLRIKM